MEIDLTQVILAVTTLLSLCGWFVNGRKHRAEIDKQRTEIESLKADIQKQNLDLAKQFVEEFLTNIVEPLKKEVKGLRNDVKKLRKAVAQASNCTYRDECPVHAELQKQSAADDDTNI